MKRLRFLPVLFAIISVIEVYAQPCSGTPPSVTASSSLSSACNQTATLSLSGVGSVTGLTFQWQDSVGGTWLNVSGGSGSNTTSYTTDNISSRKFYRCAVTCTSSAVTIYSNIISITSPCSLYYATRTTGNNYSSIAGSASSFAWRNYASGANVSMPVSLPPSVFDFNYMGSPVTGMVVSTNGWLSFNTSVTSSFAMTGISASTTPTRALFPFWRSGGFINNDTLPTGVYYQISGSPGTRVLTVEWASSLYNMQVKLYEGTNNFEYRYGPMMNLADGNSSPVTQYKVLYTGPVIGNPVVSGQFRIQTTPNHSAFGTTDNMFLYEDLPTGYSNIMFSLSNVGYVSQPAPPTIPVNDNPANATLISLSSDGCKDISGTYYSTKNATASGTGPNCSGNPDDDVWFRFVAPVSGAVKITVRCFDGDYDPAFQVLNSSYDTTGIGAGACTNASGAGIFERTVIRGLTSGQHYYIRLYHAGSGWLVSGSSSKAVFSLCVSDTTAGLPANDICANAIPLSINLTGCVDTVVHLNNSEPTAGLAACGSGGDVWYTFSSPTNRMVILLTHTTSTRFALYRGNCSALTQDIACTQISSPGSASYNFSIQAGQTYYLRISSTSAVAPLTPRLFCLFSVSAPNVPASNLTFTGTSSVSTQLSWTKGNGARRIVVGRVTSSPIDYPTDLVPVKFRSPVFGTASTELLSMWDNFVLYNDTGSSVVITGLSPSTSYSFKVFEYNGFNNAEKYDRPSGSGVPLVTLPVKFSSFQGRAYLSVAYLSWTTASELNNMGFDIERSYDMVNYSKIGFVKGNGTTSNSSVYSFNDIEAFALGNSIAYYRLKQIDYDGRFEYSSIVKVSEAGVLKNNIMSVFPNPFEKEITLNFEHPLNEKGKLIIYDIRGKEMYNAACDLYSGTNTLRIAEIDNLEDGMYFLYVVSASGNKTVKIVKGQ